MARRLLAALLAGGASVFAFAPFDLFPLAFLALGVLAWLLGRALRAREAFALGFAWGFGAFIGGDFVAARLSTGIVNDKVFSVRSLGLAIAGAVTLLLILKAMRKAVGPLRHGKSPSRRRE